MGCICCGGAVEGEYWDFGEGRLARKTARESEGASPADHHVPFEIGEAAIETRICQYDSHSLPVSVEGSGANGDGTGSNLHRERAGAMRNRTSERCAQRPGKETKSRQQVLPCNRQNLSVACAAHATGLTFLTAVRAHVGVAGRRPSDCANGQRRDASSVNPCCSSQPTRGGIPGLTSLATPFHLANEPALVSIPRWVDPLRDDLDRLTSDGRDARRTIEKFGTAAATLRAG